MINIIIIPITIIINIITINQFMLIKLLNYLNQLN